MPCNFLETEDRLECFEDFDKEIVMAFKEIRRDGLQNMYKV